MATEGREKTEKGGRKKRRKQGWEEGKEEK